MFKRPAGILLALAVMAGALSIPRPLAAQSEAAELERLTREVEAAEKQFWALKERQLRERSQIADQLATVEEGLKGQYLKKNNLLEESYLIAENINSLNESYEQKKIAWGTLQSRLAELARIEEKKTRGLYPQLIPQAILRTGLLGQVIEAGDVGRSIETLVDYRLWLLDEAERFEWSTRPILDSATRSRIDVPVLRMGFVHASYADEKHAGFMVRQSGLGGVFYDWNQKIPDRLTAELGDPLKALQRGEGAKPGAMVTVMVDPVQAGNRIKSLAQDQSSSIWAKFVVWFKDGGLTMYPLIIVFVIGMVITVERVRLFWRIRGSGIDVVESAVKKLQAGEKEEAWSLLNGSKYPLARIVKPLFETGSLNRITAERLLEEKMVQELPKLEQRIPTLAVLATIAPLLGLLGTVAGMITLFETINIYGAANPKILAGGISEALVATETGLGVAIPLSLVHHILMRVKSGMLSDIEKSTVKILNELYPENT